MLFDLTRLSGLRVAQVDELRLGGRHWVRSTDVLLFLAGLAAGALPATGLRMLTGGWIPWLLIPLGGILSLVMFSRKRSVNGEITLRRFDRLMNRAKRVDGGFILPGSDRVFSPNDYGFRELHDHPVDLK